MSGMEKTKLQFDMELLIRRINGCPISNDLKRFARDVLERAEKCIDYEPCTVRGGEHYHACQS